MADNTHRFDGLADIYDASRPDYPVSATRHIAGLVARVDLPKVCLDVGAGTGISTRALARQLPGWSMIGIEPNADMATRANTTLEPNAPIRFEHGTAESLPAQDGSVGLIAVAQALHWFDRPRFFAHAAQILASDGVIAIMNNNRQTDLAPALAAVETFVEAENPQYSRDYRKLDITHELHASGHFDDVERTEHPWQRTVTPESLADYFMSRSSAPAICKKLGVEQTRQRFIDCIVAEAGRDPFTIPIVCEVIAGRRTR